ncbi:hypothetical protein BV25DRAFT_1817865 [Artomyces pyxidatus]|uniref:Uncharacterized protein n=1 Tax=Artomyces pyxidatus TaxID=48021 RepID=A0ACB8TKI2_9AGAM|nr:hypothetical protein BV25DRAFT_1817865 [Artomyces pyxidatus]
MLWLSLHTLSRRTSSAADRLLKAEEQRKYVRELWIFLGSVIAALAFVRLCNIILSLTRTHKPSPSSPKPMEVEKGSFEPTENGAQRRISWRRLPIALATAFRTVAFRWTIPIGPRSVMSISELTFIIGYIVATFLWLLADTRDLTAMFYEDRAAHFASSNLALVVALAGKNNIISFVTGIGHEKLNVLHRAAARTCLIFLWLHAATHASMGLPEVFDFTHVWMRWGVVGLTSFTLATVLSIRPIRQSAFEFFLISHIILIAIFLIAGVLHTRAVKFDNYIWPALVIWALDRLLRLLRVVWNSRIWRGFGHSDSKASVELLSEDTVRLTLRRSFNWKPGQHAYVILPTVSTLPTEAHPFTIASIPNSVDGTLGAGEKDLVFIIRGRSGFTSRLRDYAIQKGSHTVPALVDGPYGCPPDLTSFSTCVLIAGGSGVSYTLPLLMEAVRTSNLNRSTTRRVVFVWSVRDAGHLTWISKLLGEAISAAPPSLTIEPRIYVTGARLPVQDIPSVAYAGSSNPSLESPIKEKPELPSYNAFKITHGRPSIRRLLQDEIASAAGPVSVDVAGPSAIAQSVRSALRSSAGPLDVLKGAPSVTLHVETFGMVKG